MKRCPDCGETLPLERFSPGRRGRPRSYCRTCNSARVKRWRQAHPERDFGARVRARWLRVRGVLVLEVVERRVVLDRAGGRCQSCGVALLIPGNPDSGVRWQVDHRIPVRLGGVHSYANTQALCIPCHVAKTNRERGVTHVSGLPQS
jgi:5-methylcytosine-specific restriction endonuclease McrA